ncbi:hypothetical protein CFOL_v3_22275 [Cephalotus follicularis]|uniref:Uncharacterized protein n=1 Tax=Cephalotus follicularis TaxID=3775 RepID=A0A1Q3CEY9_CEPFO|nr:hypothetical protein CFOL_v3_22275 [Cephalotus follicularis]
MAAASLQIIRSTTLAPISIPRQPTNIPGKPGDSHSRKRVPKLTTCRSSTSFLTHKFVISCAAQQPPDNQTNGEEPPESLFMKELKRRGMTPTSRSNLGLDDEIKLREEDGGFSKRNAVTTDVEKSLLNQRERSIALNSEGLEGLVPRAKLLLTVGGTFFLGFGPLILTTVAFFSALYLYFGPTFVHVGGGTPISPPQYVDPYALLEDERTTQTAPRVY